MTDRLTMAPPTRNVNEWAQAVREIFPGASFHLYRGSPIRSPYAMATHGGGKVGEWYELGSYWIGNADPEKPDQVGNSAECSRVEDFV